MATSQQTVYWVAVAVVLAIPVIIFALTFNLQKTVLLKHTQSGLTKKGFFGFSWTYLFFGWLVPVFRGEIAIGVLHFILSVISFGLFQFIMAFLFNKQYTSRQLTSGWQLADDERVMTSARMKLGIAAP